MDVRTKSVHFLPENGWIKKERSRGSSGTNDVQIVIVNAAQGNKPKNLTVRFYNNTGDLISDTGFAQIQIYKNRMFFRGSDEKTGYKLSSKAKNPTTKALQITISSELANEYSSLIGDYELKYDSFYEYYYVELED